jgi:hypothetical protein
MAKQKQKDLVRSSIPLGATQFAADATFVNKPTQQFVRPENVAVKRWADGNYRQNPDGSTSTHIMTDFEADGKHYAAPTLYPKDRKGTKSRNPKDWYQAPEKGFAFADTAQARGELYGPFQTQKIAHDFAANGYKNMPAQKKASSKLLKKKK